MSKHRAVASNARHVAAIRLAHPMTLDRPLGEPRRRGYHLTDCLMNFGGACTCRPKPQGAPLGWHNRTARRGA